MPLLNIDLMTPDGILFEGNEIPDDLQSAELVARLVNTLGLPRTTAGGEPINYSLEIVNQGVRLQSGQTLGDAGATNGDVIRLLSSHKVQATAELKPPQMPAVTGKLSPDGAQTTSGRSGAVIVIPVRGPNASVTKILGRLRDSLGVAADEISVITPQPTSKLSAPVATVPKPSRLGAFGNNRTMMLAGMAVVAFFFMVFAINSKNKAQSINKDQAESIAQANEPTATSATIPAPTPIVVEPTPEPTPEATPDATPEPVPEPKQEAVVQPASTPATRTKVKVLWVVKTIREPAPPVVKPQRTPIELLEGPTPSSLLVAQNVNKMPEMPSLTPVVAQDTLGEVPAPPKKCGMWRKMMVGCKEKKPKKSKTGGAVGVAESSAESRAKGTIRRGVGKAIP